MTAAIEGDPLTILRRHLGQRHISGHGTQTDGAVVLASNTLLGRCTFRWLPLVVAAGLGALGVLALPMTLPWPMRGAAALLLYGGILFALGDPWLRRVLRKGPQAGSVNPPGPAGGA